MGDERIRVAKGWGRQIVVVELVVVDAAVDVERVEERVVRTTNQPWEELSKHCRHTHHEKLLCQKSIKVLNSHYVQVDRKFGLRPRGNLSRGQSWVARILRARTKAGHHFWVATKLN